MTTPLQADRKAAAAAEADVKNQLSVELHPADGQLKQLAKLYFPGVEKPTRVDFKLSQPFMAGKHQFVNLKRLDVPLACVQNDANILRTARERIDREIQALNEISSIRDTALVPNEDKYQNFHKFMNQRYELCLKKIKAYQEAIEKKKESLEALESDLKKFEAGGSLANKKLSDIGRQAIHNAIRDLKYDIGKLNEKNKPLIDNANKIYDFLKNQRMNSEIKKVANILIPILTTHKEALSKRLQLSGQFKYDTTLGEWFERMIFFERIKLNNKPDLDAVPAMQLTMHYEVDSKLEKAKVRPVICQPEADGNYTFHVAFSDDGEQLGTLGIKSTEANASQRISTFNGQEQVDFTARVIPKGETADNSIAKVQSFNIIMFRAKGPSRQEVTDMDKNVAFAGITALPSYDPQTKKWEINAVDKSLELIPGSMLLLRVSAVVYAADSQAKEAERLSVVQQVTAKGEQVLSKLA